MINIDLLNPKSQAGTISKAPPPRTDSPAMVPPDEPVAVPSSTPSARFSASSWQGIVLINIGSVIVIVTVIMLLPANIPVIGGFIRPAKIALLRFFNMIF